MISRALALRGRQTGNVDAQRNLGVMYRYSEGVQEDPVITHVWANIASTNGAENGRELRGLIEEDLTAAQLARATELAHMCMNSNYLEVRVVEDPQDPARRMRDLANGTGLQDAVPDEEPTPHARTSM